MRTLSVGRSSRNKAKGSSNVARYVPSNGRRRSEPTRVPGTGGATSAEHTVERHLPLAKSIVHRLYGSVRCRATYDDLLAAAIVGLWKSIKGYDPKRASFSTYATFRIRGYIQDWLRSVRSQGHNSSVCPRKFKHLSEKQWHIHSELIGRPDPTAPIELREEAEKLLAECDDRERAYIHDRFWECLEFREIAAKYGVSHQWVYFVINRALDRLREQHASV